MGNSTVAKRLAVFINETSYENIPEDAIEKAKLCLFDLIFVAIGGQLSNLPAVKIITQYAKEISGAKEAIILGDGSHIPCEYAAMVNSVASEILELSDGDPTIIGHAGQAVIPSALAIAEKENVSGSELLAAIVVGYDVMVRIGYAVMPSAFDRGLSSSGCLGSFGAVAAASKILQLNKEEIINALGLAAFASGFRESWTGTGTMDKDLMVGEATRRGLLAAMLAKKGFSGASTILEGKRGFCHSLADDVDFNATLKGLGEEYKILNQYLKAYPSCRHTHATIDAVLELANTHSLRAKDIRSVKIYLNEHAAAIAIEAPDSYVGVRFSQQFAASVALLKRKATIHEFTEEMAKDQELRGLMGKVEIGVDPILDKMWPEKWASRVEVTLANGETLSNQVDYPKGDVRNPINEKELQQKLMSLMLGRVSKNTYSEVAKKVNEIEGIRNIRELTALLSV
jgi:2-methylcitrate dehydratase PrpD